MRGESSEVEVYVTREGIAWVHDPAQRGSFASIVLRHAGLDRASLSAAVARAGEPKLSHLAGAPFPRGSISPDVLRDAVREHNATMLAPLLGERAPTHLRVHGTLATGQVFAFTLQELRDEAQLLARRGALTRSDAFASFAGREPSALPRTRKVQPTGDMLAAPSVLKPQQRVGLEAFQQGLCGLAVTDGFCGAAVARFDNGAVLASFAGSSEMEMAEPLRSAGESLAICQRYADRQPSPDRVDELVFSTREHHFLARRVARRDYLFLFLIVARATSTLGMASHALREAESALVL
jgi:hypothetical protein